MKLFNVIIYILLIVLIAQAGTTDFCATPLSIGGNIAFNTSNEITGGGEVSYGTLWERRNKRRGKRGRGTFTLFGAGGYASILSGKNCKDISYGIETSMEYNLIIGGGFSIGPLYRKLRDEKTLKGTALRLHLSVKPFENKWIPITLLPYYTYNRFETTSDFTVGLAVRISLLLFT